MAEGQKPVTEPKNFTANVSPPSGNSLQENPGNRNEARVYSEASSASSIPGGLPGSRPQSAGHDVDKESGIEETERSPGDEIVHTMVGLPSLTGQHYGLATDRKYYYISFNFCCYYY